MQITLDYTKTLEQNAAMLYEKAKKARKKRQGAEASLKRTEEQLEKGVALQKKTELAKERKRPWYDHFHWFISSEDFLVIGGRDATTNEIIVKKQTAQGDFVFPSELAGSPFFVVKAEGKKIGEITKTEAAIATASYSRAWRQGLTTMEVFAVAPDQLSKTPQSGEYISKGSFIVRGRKERFMVSLQLALGVYREGIMAGPLSAVSRHCSRLIEIAPGKEKSGKAAKLIQKRIGGELDDIIRGIPAGGVQVKGVRLREI